MNGRRCLLALQNPAYRLSGHIYLFLLIKTALKPEALGGSCLFASIGRFLSGLCQMDKVRFLKQGDGFFQFSELVSGKSNRSRI